MANLQVLLLSVLLYAGCSQSGKRVQPLPTEIQVSHHDRNLYRQENLWRYNGRVFSGYIVQLSGDTMVIHKLPVIDGLANGLAVGYYENGNKMMEQFFEYNKLQGSYKQWWRNGQPRYVFNYKDDEFDGSQKVFFENGKLREESNFSNGKREGLQRVWDDKGQLISNYTIRNNKLYGIVNVESCIPGMANK